MNQSPCIKCGSGLRTTSRFCPICGEQARPAEPAAKPGRPAEGAYSLPPSRIRTSTIKDGKPRKGTARKINPLVSIGIVISFIVLVGVTLYLSGMFAQDDSEEYVPGGRPKQADPSAFTVPDYERWPNPDGKYNAAFTAIRFDPYDTLAYYDLGYAYIEDGRLADALVPLEVALAIDPEWYWTNITLANVYMDLGVSDKGQQRMVVLSLIQQEDDYCQYNAALMMLRYEEYDLAVECFRQAISVDSENPEYRHDLAIAYLKMGRDELAEQELVMAMLLSSPGEELYESARSLLK